MWLSCFSGPGPLTHCCLQPFCKMTSHKHSFQCFDAVVEKPALITGNNFALPHTSSCTPTQLDQLENRRCSLCSEPQQVKPVTSEVSGNESVAWYQPQSPSHQHTPRKPIRPEREPVNDVAHHHHNHHHTHRHRKRIVLVKNSNPSIQKTILLHRKPAHSFCVFMDDVSELMHCFIRKLYTLDGHKVRPLCECSYMIYIFILYMELFWGQNYYMGQNVELSHLKAKKSF